MSPDRQAQIDREFEEAIAERLEAKRVFGQTSERIKRAARESISMSNYQKQALITLRGLMRWASEGKTR